MLSFFYIYDKIIYNSTEYKIIIYGDVDRDGLVSIKDLYQVYIVFKGKTTSLNNIQKLAADYDSSGLTDIVDLYKVYKKMKEK